MDLWTISDEPEEHVQGDRHGFKWPLSREGYEPLFTMVWFSAHALMKLVDDDVGMTDSALLAVDTRGRSEVERYLDQELPVRVIEVARGKDPWVTATRP